MLLGLRVTVTEVQPHRGVAQCYNYSGSGISLLTVASQPDASSVESQTRGETAHIAETTKQSVATAVVTMLPAGEAVRPISRQNWQGLDAVPRREAVMGGRASARPYPVSCVRD